MSLTGIVASGRRVAHTPPQGGEVRLGEAGSHAYEAFPLRSVREEAAADR
jgi:hypothetical protein